MKYTHFRGPLTAAALGVLALLVLGVQTSGGLSPAGPPGREAIHAPAAAVLPSTGNETLYEEGVQLYAQGRLAEARRVFRVLLRRDPHDASARLAVDRVEAELIQGARSETRRTR